MTNYCVDSTATGAGDGGADVGSGVIWDDAWTDSASITGVSGGDIILCDDGHVDPAQDYNAFQTGGSNQDQINPVFYISVDKSDDSYSPGALLFNATNASGDDIRIEGNAFFLGIDGDFNDDIAVAGVSPTAAQGWGYKFIDCTFRHVGTSSWSISFGNYRTSCYLKNVTIDKSTGSGSFFGISLNGLWEGGALVGAHGGTFGVFQNGANAHGTVIGVNFSDDDANIYNDLNEFGSLKVINCNLHTTTLGDLLKTEPTATDDVPGQLLVEGCGTGTITERPISLNLFQNGFGKAEGQTAVNRSSGASDGDNDWSIKATGRVTGQHMPFRFPVGTVDIEAGDVDVAQTYRIYFAHNGVGGGTGTRLLDTEFWPEIEGPSNLSSATAQAYIADGGAVPFAAGADVGVADPDDNWNGSGVGVDEYVDIGYTPKLIGEVIVYANLGINDLVYFCPKIAVNP